MSVPYSAGRDSSAARGNAFDQEADVSDSHFGSFNTAFRPPTDRLAEEDYRSSEHGGSAPNASFEPVVPHSSVSQSPQRFTYPEPGPAGKDI
jgi:hypothetical protein